jgi:hypothetical protein
MISREILEKSTEPSGRLCTMHGTRAALVQVANGFTSLAGQAAVLIVLISLAVMKAAPPP